MRSVVYGSLSFLLSLAACAAPGPQAPHVALDESAEPLRTAFNADSGKVRSIWLVSPT